MVDFFIGTVSKLHHRFVLGRRTRVLAQHVAEMIPANAHTVLDVGCGNGWIDRLVHEARPDLTITGVDVLKRPDAVIPVQQFDGHQLPADDRSCDIVTFVDVLHHTADPMILLREAVRVAKMAIIIKDHTRNRRFDRPILTCMDWVGNRGHGVALPNNYWSNTQWQRAWSQLGLTVDESRYKLDLYPWFARPVFEIGLHMICRLLVDETVNVQRRI